MMLSQKETMLLKDLKSQEELCIDKYARAENQAADPQLQSLFASIGKTEQQHLNTIDGMLKGNVPAAQSGGAQPPQKKPDLSNANAQIVGNNGDKYLCQDALDTEKHVSSVYDTCIFEFKDESARTSLNHIQKEEQEHGKKIYDYMAQHGMYNA